MPRARLHLDEDASSKSLYRALLARGHDITRTPTDWMPLGASDEMQLLGAAAQGRCIFTFNIPDFSRLAKRYPEHRGIVLAVRSNWKLPELIAALDHLLSETTAEEWIGQVRWLNRWRDR